MILKFKDSKNNWKYVQLGDFTVNRLDIGNIVSESFKKYNLDQIDKAVDDLECRLNVEISKKMDINIGSLLYDKNILNKMNNILVINNLINSPKIEKKGEFNGNAYYYTDLNYEPVTYVISDEAYLMNEDGKTIEKLM